MTRTRKRVGRAGMKAGATRQRIGPNSLGIASHVQNSTKTGYPMARSNVAIMKGKEATTLVGDNSKPPTRYTVSGY